MGQRSRRRSRERAPAAGRDDFAERYRARGAQRDAEARARLKPLEPGDRPGAVTAGAIVAAALGLANLGFWVAGGEVSGERQPAAGVILYSALMLVAAWGQWRARYWAVLGMQVLLGLLILVFAVLVVTASNLAAVVVSVVVIAGAGTLFWLNVKAMARIQMPERPR